MALTSWLLFGFELESQCSPGCPGTHYEDLVSNTQTSARLSLCLVSTRIKGVRCHYYAPHWHGLLACTACGDSFSVGAGQRLLTGCDGPVWLFCRMSSPGVVQSPISWNVTRQGTWPWPSGTASGRARPRWKLSPMERSQPR